MSSAREDWAAVLDRLLAGDEVAYLKLSRLVTGFLAGWRAYDFRDEWDDLVQEVLLAVVRGARQGRIRAREATLMYVRRVTHNKYADRLDRHLGRGEGKTLAWEEEGEGAQTELPHQPAHDDEIVGVRLSLEKLPENQRKVVFAVYGQKRTYAQVAADTGIPLGSVKRYLREGLAALKAQYEEAGAVP